MKRNIKNIFLIEKNHVLIGGNGTQVISTMMAHYLAKKILNQPHSLDKFFS